MRVLVLNSEIPFPPIGGAALRTYHLVEALASHHSVTLVGFDVSWAAGDAETLRALPVDVLRVPRHGQLSPWLVDQQGRPTPSAASGAMRSALGGLRDAGFDAVLIEHSWMGQYIDALPPHVPRILDLHNVHSRTDHPGPGPAPTQQMLHFERGVAAASDVCVTVSEEEAALARALLGVADPHVIPNAVDLDYFSPATGSEPTASILFTGFLAYPPNIDAVRFFADAVLPTVLRAVPEAVFDVVGAAPTDAVRALASPSVVVHGLVADVRPFFQRAAVVVVPLQAGGGTRVKILEAAACGKAIVSTSIGAEGLRFRPGVDLLIADQAQAIASAVIDLLRSPVRREALGRSARAAARPYGLGEVQPRFRALVESTSLAGA